MNVHPPPHLVRGGHGIDELTPRARVLPVGGVTRVQAGRRGVMVAHGRTGWPARGSAVMAPKRETP